MEAVLFIGIPASGKSSFYTERFAGTHVRISRDILKTKHRERRFIETCLETNQSMVIDNTCPTRLERQRLINLIRSSSTPCRVVGYYFQSRIADCLRRNHKRADAVPEVAIIAKAKQLELPSLSEGFERLFYVRLTETGFEVEQWNDEI
ncbi:AAA family ATPase [Bremerella sp. JC817]|uniref:AAA family ATPase n=1 Tax=Bremerella sp. JC817 TaxID=3231756 RepID=UPI0034579EFC